MGLLHGAAVEAVGVEDAAVGEDVAAVDAVAIDVADTVVGAKEYFE